MENTLERILTASSHRLNSDKVQNSGSILKPVSGGITTQISALPPLGSLSAGKISPPHIFHSAEAVTMPAKPVLNFQR